VFLYSFFEMSLSKILYSTLSIRSFKHFHVLGFLIFWINKCGKGDMVLFVIKS